MAASRKRRRDGSADYLVDADSALALIALLKEKGFRRKDLADAIPMSPAGISKIGKKGTVRRSTLDKLRDVVRKSGHPWYLDWLRGTL